jgi:hypothetical protein
MGVLSDAEAFGESPAGFPGLCLQAWEDAGRRRAWPVCRAEGADGYGANAGVAIV